MIHGPAVVRDVKCAFRRCSARRLVAARSARISHRRPRSGGAAAMRPAPAPTINDAIAGQAGATAPIAARGQHAEAAEAARKSGGSVAMVPSVGRLPQLPTTRARKRGAITTGDRPPPCVVGRRRYLRSDMIE